MTEETAARIVRVDAFVAQMQRTERAALVQAIEREDMAEIERAGIAKRIREARKEAGLSQPEMAAAIGVIPRTYQNYESVKDPRTPWGSMNDIAKVSGKSTEWLIHGTQTPDVMSALGGSSQLDNIEALLTKIAVHLHVDLEELATATEEVAARGERASEQPPASAESTGAQGSAG